MFARGASVYSIRLVTQNIYLPDIPLLIRVELLDEDGKVNRSIWNNEVFLKTDNPAMQISTNKIFLRNGLGSALVRFSGGGNFVLTAYSGDISTTKTLTDGSGLPILKVGGTLQGDSTVWQGIINITNDLVVPTNHTLTILSNSIILIDGVTSGTTAPDILINGGKIECLGSETSPIVITCSQNGRRWGQIRHNTALPSIYRWTSINLGGRAPGEGHTGTGPVIRATNSRIIFENCNLTDFAEPNGTPGKVAQASGSDIVITNCHLARARMGPEIGTTGLLCIDTWITDMRGPDDADGIYLHNQSSGQLILLKNCVIADGDDDGIDTLDSTITVDNCIIRDWTNRLEDAKGISVFNGATHLTNSLVVNCTVGVSAKTGSGNSARVTINRSTIVKHDTNVVAQWKSNATGPNVGIYITNSIIWYGDTLHSDFGQSNIVVAYSIIGEQWQGVGIIISDPLFEEPLNWNYNLTALSPAIDAGNPSSPLDPDGTRPDLGCFFFDQRPRIELQPQDLIVTNGSIATFSISAKGALPIYYQWYFNNSPVQDATNAVLNIFNVNASNNGNYYIVVSNYLSVITSKVTRLTVETTDDDGDGMPDDWEITFGLDPHNNMDAALDNDNDGLTNLQEFLAGTDPTDPSSVLRLSIFPFSFNNTSNILIEFTAVAGKTYVLEFRDKVGAGMWNELLQVSPQPQTRLIRLTNQINNELPQRFFRTRTLN